MKSAEEILDEHYKPKMHWRAYNRHNVLIAMFEYANSRVISQPLPVDGYREATEFADWIAKGGYISTTLPHEPIQRWQLNFYDRKADKFIEGSEVTSQELFDLFKSSPNQEQGEKQEQK